MKLSRSFTFNTIQENAVNMLPIYLVIIAYSEWTHKSYIRQRARSEVVLLPQPCQSGKPSVRGGRALSQASCSVDLRADDAAVGPSQRQATAEEARNQRARDDLKHLAEAKNDRGG